MHYCLASVCATVHADNVTVDADDKNRFAAGFKTYVVSIIISNTNNKCIII